MEMHWQPLLVYLFAPKPVEKGAERIGTEREYERNLGGAGLDDGSVDLVAVDEI